MSKYAENNLGRGEEIVLKAKKSIFCAFPQILFLILMIVAYVFVNSSIKDAEGKFGANPISGIGAYSWVLLILGALPLIVRLIVLWGMNLVVTNKRVIGKIGVLKIQALDYHIEKVDNVSLKAGVFGNLFHYHTLVVQGGGDNAQIKFIGISNANAFKNAVNEAIEKHEAEARKQQAEEIAKAMGK